MPKEDVLVLLGTKDAAELLGQSPDAVRAATKRGDIPVAAITPSGVRLLAKSAVEEYLRRRAEDPRFDHIRARGRRK